MFEAIGPRVRQGLIVERRYSADHTGRFEPIRVKVLRGDGLPGTKQQRRGQSKAAKSAMSENRS